jgi:hypothetical protein
MPKVSFLGSLTTGLKHLTGCGLRFVIAYTGGKKGGFVNDAKFIFLTKKISANYHNAMGSKGFEKWFQVQLLSNIQPGSVIFMDSAAYHSC